VHAMVALGVVLALVGIIQYTVTGGASYTLKIYGFWTPQFRGSPFGPFVNRNHFAGWMLMGLPLAIATACGAASSFRGPGLRRFIAWLSASPDAGQMQLMAGASAIMALSLLMASSRSGILGLGVAALLATGLVLRRQKTRRARGWVVFLAVFFLVAAAGWAGVDALVLRINTVSSDGSAGGRLQTWKDALTIVRNFPVIGAGLNGFGMAMTQYQTSNRSIHFEQAHNDYLQLLAEGGILLGVAVVATLAIFINAIRRRFREAPHQGSTYWARVGAVIGLIAIAVQSLFEFSLQIPGNAAMFCVLAAIAIHRSPSVRRSPGDPNDINYGDASHTS
jgi:O-antigen ligase